MDTYVVVISEPERQTSQAICRAGDVGIRHATLDDAFDRFGELSAPYMARVTNLLPEPELPPDYQTGDVPVLMYNGQMRSGGELWRDLGTRLIRQRYIVPIFQPREIIEVVGDSLGQLQKRVLELYEANGLRLGYADGNLGVEETFRRTLAGQWEKLVAYRALAEKDVPWAIDLLMGFLKQKAGERSHAAVWAAYLPWAHAIDEAERRAWGSVESARLRHTPFSGGK